MNITVNHSYEQYCTATLMNTKVQPQLWTVMYSHSYEQ